MDLRLTILTRESATWPTLLFLDEALGPEWVERWARERGKLDALREWRMQEAKPQSRTPYSL